MFDTCQCLRHLCKIMNKIGNRKVYVTHVSNMIFCLDDLKCIICVKKYLCGKTSFKQDLLCLIVTSCLIEIIFFYFGKKNQKNSKS